MHDSEFDALRRASGRCAPHADRPGRRTRVPRRPARRLFACAWRRHFALSAAIAAALSTPAPGGAPRVEITLDAQVCPTPYSGRVFFMTTRNRAGNPITSPNWFSTEPFYALDVKAWNPGETYVFDFAKADGFPGPIEDLPAGKYRVAAAIDLNRESHHVVNAPGNAYSDGVNIELGPDAATSQASLMGTAASQASPATHSRPAAIKLVIDRVIQAPKLKDTDRLKYVKSRSRLLSDFHRRDVFIHAAVALPASYAAETARRYPALYVIPGFGGGIEHARFLVAGNRFRGTGVEFVSVLLHPDCANGHHVFADSDNNGPWGKALTEEFIPFLEKEYRLIADPDARYVNGHSSGGWSSLWLQVAYADFFGGTWSSSPDPVDFTDFQRINIYDPAENVFVERDGSPRPLSRKEFFGQIWYREFSRMEDVIGRGGQLQSFEAVFGPRGADGRPAKLWDRKTGKIDTNVAESWRRYDIRHILEANWATLGPKLAGKLHLFCGDKDTFYLDGAFYKLRDALKKLGSDAYVEVVPGANHGLPPSVDQTMAKQMAEQFRRRYEAKQR